MENQYISMPMVALRGMTILPEMVIHFDVSRSRSIESIQKAMQNKEQKIFLVAQRELNIEVPMQKDVYEMGCIATIKQVAKMNKDVFRVLVTGEERAKLVKKAERRVKDAELEIERIESLIAEVEGKLATPEGATSMPLFEQHASLKKQLDKVVEEWELAMEEMEQFT
jgi:ATP-dependent Lon protease